MFSLAVWYLTLALELLLIVRALSGGFLRTYILFYIYVSWVLALSSTRFVIYMAAPHYYRPFYWYTQPLSVLAGCAVLWEIYRQALGRYPGAARMARNLFLLFLLLVFSKVLVSGWNTASWWPKESTAILERDLRAVQAILLIAFVVVLVHYAIPLSKNLKGMILGYGFFVGTSVINLTYRIFLGDSFQKLWQYLQPMFYLVVLIIWCLTLWSYQAAPLAALEPRVEADYQLLAARTRERLLLIRAYLLRAIRQ